MKLILLFSFLIGWSVFGDSKTEDDTLQDLIGQSKEHQKKALRSGDMGSYALKLSEYGIQAEIHGYLSTEFKTSFPKPIPTFDLHHAVLMTHIQAMDRVSAEFAVEWEHLALGFDDFYLSWGFIDTKITNLFVVRAGYFPVPIGAFNEFLYPDFARITIQKPLMLTDDLGYSIIPALWSEVGLQLRGKYPFASHKNLSYSLYISNGLEQTNDNSLDIGTFKKHARDTSNSDKAFGGRIAIQPLEELEIGISGYTGAYSTDGSKRINLLDLDITGQISDLTLRAEGVLGWQDTAAGILNKSGFYTLGSYRINDYLEPYLQADAVFLDNSTLVSEKSYQGLGGIAVYPFPKAGIVYILKVEGSAVAHSFKETEGKIFAQLVLGF